MPSAAAQPVSRHGDVDIAELKAKQVNGHTELEQTVLPPVHDDYMYDFKYNHSLPTIASLGTEPSHDVDVELVANELSTRLSQAWGGGDADSFAAMFLDYGALPHRLCTS